MCLFILIFVSNLGYKKSMIKAVFFDIDGTLVSFKTHEVDRKSVV